MTDSNDTENISSNPKSFSPVIYPEINNFQTEFENKTSAIATNASPNNVQSIKSITSNHAMEDDFNESEYNGQNNSHFRKQPKRTTSNLDSKSPAILMPHRQISFNRATSYQSSIGGHSQHSHSDLDHLIPPPSTPQEKSKMTRKYFATVFALCYAIFLVVFGLVVFISDAVVPQYPIGEAFAIYMLSVGFLYFIILYIDIRLHIKKAQAAMKEREKRQQLFNEQMDKMHFGNGNGPMELSNGYHTSMQIPEWNIPAVEAVSHRYCFQTGRHGELFYLKLGAAWFCFGLLIHSMLIISYQVIFLTTTEPNYGECSSVITLVLEIMFPLYSIFVLFFIFKYANVIINEGRGLARFFIMHAIGTSLAFWIFTIVRETVDAIRLKNLYKLNYKDNDTDISENVKKELMMIACPAPEALNSIYRNFSPYLYPFVIEFCILIVGIYYIIYANINRCPRKHSAPGHHQDPIDQQTQRQDDPHETKGGLQHSPSISSDHCNNTLDHDNNFKSNSVIHADCHAAHRGLFAGLILIVLTIVFIILFFVAVYNDDYFSTGITVNSSFELSVLVILIFTVIAAYFQVSQLDINTHPMSKLDDVLLFIAIPAFLMETIFSMVPAIYNGSVLNILIICAQLIQVLIQTPFIIDGLRRCANASVLRRKKPGRELVTFLTIANVSLWIFYTFSVKTADTGDERYEYYGDVLWSILNHLSLPLIMFYRFHASVCLVDIWKHAYEPGGGH